MAMLVKRVGLLSDKHLPVTTRPRKGATLIVYHGNMNWSDYTAIWCTGLGGKRWLVRSDYVTDPPAGARPADSQDEKHFVHEVRNLQIERSLTEIEFSPLHGLLHTPVETE